MKLYRELIKHFLLSLKGENKFETIGLLLVILVAISPIYFLFFAIAYLIDINFYVNRWYIISIPLFISYLVISGSYISRIQDYEKSIKYHNDLEKKIRYFIFTCKNKKINDALIIEDIELALDMLHDPSIKYYYRDPIKILDKKMEEIEKQIKVQ